MKVLHSRLLSNEIEFTSWAFIVLFLSSDFHTFTTIRTRCLDCHMIFSHNPHLLPLGDNNIIHERRTSNDYDKSITRYPLDYEYSNFNHADKNR